MAGLKLALLLTAIVLGFLADATRTQADSRDCEADVTALMQLQTQVAAGSSRTSTFSNTDQEDQADLVAPWLGGLTRTTSSSNAEQEKGTYDFSTNAALGVAPLQFLIMSSPTGKKVGWTTLQNFASSDGRAFPLIDSGLVEPKGLAFDHTNGHLYIADSGAKTIFRYTILTDVTGVKPTLVTSGVRLTVLQGHPVEWVTVDDDGNLFYTAPDTNNINKISAATLARLGTGEIGPTQLLIVSEKTLETKSMLKSTIQQKTQDVMRNNDFLTDKPLEPPNIYSMYEAAINPHVSAPASIWADGTDLYWTNGQDGKTAGTIVKGQVDPKSFVHLHGASAFPAAAVTNISDGAFGLTKTNRFMYFTRDGPGPRTGLVSGLVTGTNITIDISNRLVRPRGLAWDRDQTMYVADEDQGEVWSFPAGRLTANMPLTRTVHFDGAYGMVLMSSKDQAFSENRREVRRGAFEFQEESKLMLNQLKKTIFLQTGHKHYEFEGSSRRAQGVISALAMIAAAAGILVLLD